MRIEFSEIKVWGKEGPFKKATLRANSIVRLSVNVYCSGVLPESVNHPACGIMLPIKGNTYVSIDTFTIRRITESGAPMVEGLPANSNPVLDYRRDWVTCKEEVKWEYLTPLQKKDVAFATSKTVGELEEDKGTKGLNILINSWGSAVLS